MRKPKTLLSQRKRTTVKSEINLSANPIAYLTSKWNISDWGGEGRSYELVTDERRIAILVQLWWLRSTRKILFRCQRQRFSEQLDLIKNTG